MLKRTIMALTLAAFGLAAAPVASVLIGLGDQAAVAADLAVKKGKKAKKAKRGMTKKYQYIYIPSSSGPPGGWR